MSALVIDDSHHNASIILRQLEDLTNELAYIDHFPERWDCPAARLTRRAAVLFQIRYLRSLLPRIERRR